MTTFPYSIRPSLEHECAGSVLIAGRTISYFHGRSVDPLASAALDRFALTGELTGAVTLQAAPLELQPEQEA
jgi:hypothetical protein